VVNNMSNGAASGAIAATSNAGTCISAHSYGVFPTLLLVNDNPFANATLVSMLDAPAGQEVFSVKRDGFCSVLGTIMPDHLVARTNCGNLTPPDAGGYYKDNAVHVWAAVSGSGTSYGDFNCSSIQRSSAGVYIITYDRSLTDAVPVATAYGAATQPRFCMITGSYALSAVVEIFTIAGTHADSDFFFIVTGRP
jgi:hypothetical protein